MFIKTCTILSLVCAILSFLAYLGDVAFSTEPLYFILLALFLLWLPPRLAEFKK